MADSKNQIRVRFAPSPTGFVHIGSLRTALFSFLFARHNKGTHVLRIEDTDQDRLVEGAIENLLRVMHTMGIDFDEGFYLDSDQLKERGDFGPYLQSQRLDLYQKYAQQLVESGSAYYCFCDEKRLEDLRKEQIALKKPPMYDRRCRYLGKAEVERKLAEFNSQNIRPVVRQAIPEQGSTQVNDLIYGDITFLNEVLDDQVLLKSDGFPTYHLAVVVDDHLMEISHVIRGEEWISSTPKHILLYQAMGWQPTLFAHLPLILNPDKSKLSKRQGDVSVEDFLAKGYLKEALINFVAFLGWNPKTKQEIFSLNDLTQQFDLSKVNKAAAIFDLNKLDWLNSLYIRSMAIGELTDLVIPYLEKEGYLLRSNDQFTVPELSVSVGRDYLEAIVKLEQERLKKLSEIGERTGYFFRHPDYDPLLLVWKKSDQAATLKVLTQLLEAVKSEAEPKSPSDWENVLKKFIVDNGYDNGTVLWPFRVALTGIDKSPGPYEVAAVISQGLSQREIVFRLENAINKLV